MEKKGNLPSYLFPGRGHKKGLKRAVNHPMVLAFLTFSLPFTYLLPLYRVAKATRSYLTSAGKIKREPDVTRDFVNFNSKGPSVCSVASTAPTSVERRPWARSRFWR